MDVFENIVQSDTTLNFVLREAKFDANKLEHQVDIRCTCINIAIDRYIDVLIKNSLSKL